MAYTNIDDPSAHFQTALWTGNATAGNAVTFDGNSDMQPDFVWSKRRDVGYSHILKDTSRGGTSNNDQHLVSNSTAAESTYTNYRMDFDSDGFTLDGVGDSGFQGSGTSMVSWSWKANGGTTASNTDGSINTTVQSNSTAGFNIITYTGTGGGETLGHNLGVAPDMWIIKRRSGTGSWAVGFNDSSILGGTSDYLILQSTGATSTYNNFWGSSPANSNVMRIAGDATIGGSGSTYVAYVFAQKQGYSKFGKYVGNGNANGSFVYTGFKPAFLLWKITSTTGDWRLVDTKRGVNGAIPRIKPNASSAEGSAGDNVDLLSNGFKFRSTAASANASGASYIYMAFAENPFTTSTGVPCTAR
tara:strand:+ start:9225 stop:10298 length:1074 start_codon:yes stop_codon:yes gene_type:complete